MFSLALGVKLWIRKILVSIKFPPAIPGPEMTAPILWAPGIFLVLSATISALTEPNRQKSRRKGGFWAQKSQPEIANR